MPASSSYRAFLFDDSCFLYTSNDKGLTWIETNTPDDTLLDGWSDLQMATIDADYATMVGFDNRYLGDDFQSRLGLSVTAGATGSWGILNPTGPTADDTIDHFQLFFSGAISSGGEIILALPAEDPANDLTLTYPRISRNGGSTWADITALGSGRQWAVACFNAGATVMYMASYAPSGFTMNISKSTDGGATWIDLTVPSISRYLISAGGGGRNQRIHCSADGATVIYVNANGEAYLSHNFGASWTIIVDENGQPPDFDPISILPFTIDSSNCNFADCGLSSDGTVILLSFAAIAGLITTDPSYTNSSIAFVSTDSGATWATVSTPSMTASGGVNILQACNVSPDGFACLVGYTNPDGIGHFADFSTDKGGTWTAETIVTTPTKLDWVSAYIVPLGPPPPPPFVPPKGGYIIERLDDRIWPTVENAWCVDCGFTLARPTPSADLTVQFANGAGILTGVTGLVGGAGYSSATTAQVVDNNGLGQGTGAVPVLTIVGGVITAVAFSPAGVDYVFPALVFNDPQNTGSGASATITMNNTTAVYASAAVFSGGDVGSVIRAGYGVATITAVADAQNATVDMLSPIVAVQPDDPISPNQAITQMSGTWTMTAPISQFYLPQLIGFEITGLADGQIIPPTIVPSNGLVTLAAPASAIIVGLGFTAQLQSTYLDAGEPTVQGQRKKIAEVTVRVEQSAAFQVGGNQPDGSVQSPQQLAPEWQNMVDAPTHAVAPFNSPAVPLFTGDIRVPIPSGYNTRGQVAVQQLNPLPLQILDYVPEILSGDKPAQEAPQRQRGKGNQQQ